MHSLRRRLRLCVWLALLSITALAICPTVSRLLLPGGLVAPAASAHGTGATHDHHAHHGGAMQAGAMPVSSHVPSHQHSLEHCGFCVLAAQAYAAAAAPA